MTRIRFFSYTAPIRPLIREMEIWRMLRTCVVVIQDKEGIAGLQRTPATQSLSDAVRVASIDNFQGEEAKVIVVSTVRNNKCAVACNHVVHICGRQDPQSCSMLS